MKDSLHNATTAGPRPAVNIRGAGRILVVDDEPVNRVLASDVLGGDFDIRLAASGREAIEVAGEFLPDIVLLDVMMPDLDGYETCRLLREDAVLRYTKVVLVSGRSHVGDRLRGYELGADDYVTKPYVPEELVAKVRVLLRLKHTEELSQLKENILLLLAHETRTPLTVISGAVDVLMSTDPAESDVCHDFLGMIAEAAKRLGTLMERSHLLCSLKNGQLQPTICSVDMNLFVLSVVRGMNAENTGVCLHALPATRLVTMADHDLLRVAVSSIINNAVHFGPDGSEAQVELVAGDGDVTIRVSDRGPGFDPDVLPYLFEGFSVSDIAHHSKGVGLGLAISRDIVDLHGGSIQVDSRPGEGATVSITLPLADGQSERDS